MSQTGRSDARFSIIKSITYNDANFEYVDDSHSIPSDGNKTNCVIQHAHVYPRIGTPLTRLFGLQVYSNLKFIRNLPLVWVDLARSGSIVQQSVSSRHMHATLSRMNWQPMQSTLPPVGRVSWPVMSLTQLLGRGLILSGLRTRKL